MNQNSSYEIGGKPYKPDTKRELWSKSTDFLYASLGNSMKMDLVTFVLPFMIMKFKVFSILMYLISVIIFVIPVFLLQSFLGQFSSSSYISVFRISPTFKGIGYISLLLNYTLIAYQSIFAGIPLLFLLYTIRIELPWSCAGYNQWSKNICNSSPILLNRTHKNVEFPSILFLRSHYQIPLNSEESFSWTLFLCLLVIWTIVILIVRQRTPVFGRIIRYFVWASLGLLTICLLRSLLLPGSLQTLRAEFQPNFEWDWHYIFTPLSAAIVFGTGWGSTIAMASFNKFQTNIIQYSWIICLLQVLIMTLMGMFTYLMDEHLKLTHSIVSLGIYNRQHWDLMLSVPSALADLELPHLWCLLFFIMLILAALVIISTQLYGLISALLDEFHTLREHRNLLTYGLVTSLALFSIFFCLSHPLTFFSSLATDALFTQTAINLLLLLIVLWIYGRTRFQRDFEFMLGRPFSTWLVYLLRFVTPLCGLIVLYFCYLAGRYQHSIGSLSIDVIFVLLIVLPWLFIPGYTLVNLLQTSGSFCLRFRRIVRPTDWYPLQADDQQRYLDMLGNLDINQQLREISGNDI